MKNSLHFRSKLLPRKYSSDFYLDDLARVLHEYVRELSQIKIGAEVPKRWNTESN